MRRTGAAALLLVTAIAWSSLGAACSDAAPARNLVIISIDTLRADALGCYGSARPTSPAVDAFAKAGVLCEDASATSPWTVPSHASLLTGLYPSRNGATAFLHPIHDGVEHLAVLLRDRGFDTAAIVSNPLLKGYGLERGFDHHELVTRHPFSRRPYGVTAQAIQWLRGRDAQRPFFAFVHYNDVHADYRSQPKYEAMFAEPYRGRADGTARQLMQVTMGLLAFDEADGRHLRNLYDAAVRQLDDELGHLFRFLAEEQLLDDTVVVFTSDHGEEFLEHGGVQHGLVQFEESVRIPLIFRGPGVPPATRLSQPVSLVDVMPTCLELLGATCDAKLEGVGLAGLWRHGAALPERELYYEADCAPPEPDTRVLELGSNRAVRRGALKLHHDIESGEMRLFDLDADPGEKVDVAAAQPAVARDLLDRLRQFLDSAPPSAAPRELTPEQRAVLESFGYVGSTKPEKPR